MGLLIIIAIAIVAVLVVTGVLLIILLVKRQKADNRDEIDYRAFFIMGVTFLPIGIAMMIIYMIADLPFIIALPFIIIGLIYLVLSLKNRDKWKKKNDGSRE